MERNTITHSDALTFARSLPDNSVHTVITSPPYYNLRVYIEDSAPGKEHEIGLEQSPAEYIAKLVTLFREIRRVLRDDGTCWINMGDSYVTNVHSGSYGLNRASGHVVDGVGKRDSGGLPDKSLMMMPARLAIALQDDGWILRSEITWCKPAPMPESVTDRPTKATEKVYLLAKSPRYWYDQDAIREPLADATLPRLLRGVSDHHKWTEGADGQSKHTMSQPRPNRKHDGTAHGSNGTGFQGHSGYFKENGDPLVNPLGRNKRDWWVVNSEAFPGAHFAVFPTKLIEPMILAGCPERCCAVCGAGWLREVEVKHTNYQHVNYSLTNGKSQSGGIGKIFPDTSRSDKGFRPSCDCGSEDTKPGVVYDPFMGAATTALVARALGLDYIGSELSADYIAIGRERLRLPFEEHHVPANNDVSDLPLFRGLANE
jgi:DNA modification methylase